MPPAAPQHVVIVGCGMAGTSALWQLVQQHPVRRITVFEASGRFGPGGPWQPDECADYLINNTTDSLCLLPQSRTAFIRWLALRGHPGANDPKGHLPRTLYGQFLQDTVVAAQQAAAIQGIELVLVPQAVLRLEEAADGSAVRVGWAGGELMADAVLLTTGRCPGAPLVLPGSAASAATAPVAPVGTAPGTSLGTPPATSPVPAAGPVYLASHLQQPALDAVPLDASCHVLGASLSAYDIVNRLFSPRTGCRFERDATGTLHFVPGPNQRRVVLCSRSGRLKKLQSQRPQRILRRHLTAEALGALAAQGGLTLAQVARLVDAEAAAHGTAVDWATLAAPYAGCADEPAVNARAADLLAADIRAAQTGDGGNFLVDLLADAQLLIWNGFGARWLRPDQERLYRQTLETALLCHAAPCPVPTAERLLALLRAGRLVLRLGTGPVTLAADGAAYEIPHRFGVDRATWLIDATSRVDRRVASPHQSPLVRQLYQDGLLQPYRLGDEVADGAEVEMASLRLPASPRIHLVNMLLWGPGFFTSSAFVMATLVQRALAAMFAPQAQHDQHAPDRPWAPA